MNTQRIKDVFKRVMYMDDDVIIEDNKSLFLFYDLNSVDFIDFTFELRKEFNITIKENQLWPIKSLMDNPDYYSAQGLWTVNGLQKLNESLLLDRDKWITDPAVSAKALMEYFTVNFITKILAQG